MTAITHPRPIHATAARNPVIEVRRRTIDSVLVSFGAVVAVVLVAAGGLLMWGASFASGYVHDELVSQHVAFPAAADLKAEGRGDLVPRALSVVDNGQEAQAYAGYIAGHLNGIAGGKTYADLGGPERAASAAVTAAKANGTPGAEVAVLQAKSDALTGQRNTLFKGETLRGLLLTAFAWSTVGRIAGIAAFVAFAAAAAMGLLVALGVRHHHKVVASTS